MEREPGATRGKETEEQMAMPHTEQADAGTEFSNKGVKPPVIAQFAEAPPSASQLAFEKKHGAGLAAVKKLYAERNPTPVMVAQIIQKHPDDEKDVLEWIRSALSADAAHAVLSALEDMRRAAAAPHREGGNLVINPLVGGVGATWAGSTNDEHDSFVKRDAAEATRKQAREAQSHGEKNPDPIGDMLRGPQPKSAEQLANEDKLTQGLQQSQADGGTELGVRKRLDE